MQDDWCNLAVCNVRPRDGIQMPQTLDLSEIRKALRSGHYNGITANIAVGPVFASSQKRHFTLTDEAKCPFCGQDDTMSHRVFCCLQIQPARDNCAWDYLNKLPEHSIVRGIWPQIAELRTLHAYVESVPGTLAFPAFDDGVHLLILMVPHYVQKCQKPLCLHVLSFPWKRENGTQESVELHIAGQTPDEQQSRVVRCYCRCSVCSGWGAVL